MPSSNPNSERTLSPRDTLSRPLRDLRISVTDRCNFRCIYCMPKEVVTPGYPFLQRDQLLTFEEIYRLASRFIELGVTKIRLTGGEPLLRRDVEKLVEMLGDFSQVDLTMTTNGALLSQAARPLKKAGLKRVSVSLDSLDEATFAAMNGVDFGVDDVLRGIAAAEAAGLGPVKINMVVKRGVNEDSVLPMARRFRGTGIILRFIEFMDVGTVNGWRLDDVVPAVEILSIIDAEMPLERLEPNYNGEVARRYRYRNGGGEIGIIASVTQAFCGDCTRARLTADGSLFTCLFAVQGTDLRTLLRNGATDAEISKTIRSTWLKREDRYSEIRSAETSGLAKVEMSYIGG